MGFYPLLGAPLGGQIYPFSCANNVVCRRKFFSFLAQAMSLVESAVFLFVKKFPFGGLEPFFGASSADDAPQSTDYIPRKYRLYPSKVPTISPKSADYIPRKCRLCCLKVPTISPKSADHIPWKCRLYPQKCRLYPPKVLTIPPRSADYRGSNVAPKMLRVPHASLALRSFLCI